MLYPRHGEETRSDPKTRASRIREGHGAGGIRGVDTRVDILYRQVREIIEQARATAARSVNTAMVRAYWLVGREVVEEEQEGMPGPATGTS